MKLVRIATALGSATTLCTAFLTLSPQKSMAIQTVMTQADLEKQEALKKKRDGSGSLELVDITGKKLGRAVLKHTDFQVDVAGYVNRVKVEQTFSNPYDQTVEAIYTFPLSDTGAVDHMVMKIGARTITGIIKKKEEARKTYETAKQQGKTAALLDQERPNVFTQSVANIPAHGTVKIEIQYVEYLAFENGTYSLVLPMVVAPRYMPGASKGELKGSGWSEDTTAVNDASKISPPVMPEHTRAGHDVSVTVNLNAGMPIQSIDSKLHKVEIKKNGNEQAQITLLPSDSIPNRDFVLDWKVATSDLQSGFVANKTGSIGYFSIMLVPPGKPSASQISPRELNFIIDRSGSQSGLPLQKAKETMLYILDRLNPNDTFQIISFSNDTEKVFERPELATQRNINDAKLYIADMEANGGTEMRPAVEEAAKEPAPANRLRLFIPMTDGLIGNEKELIGLVKRIRGVSRWFPFGTGDSVNRSLLDSMAKVGGGEADFVLINTNGETVAKKFFDKISTPVLTDIKIKFDGIDVSDVEPQVPNDVWAQRPVYILGRYKHAGTGSVTITGFTGGKPYTHKIALTLPESEPKNEVLPSIWARKRVDALTETIAQEAPNAAPEQKDLPPAAQAAREEIEGLGLEYHILTDYTSFVAVDDSATHTPSERQVVVPTEVPEGMSMTGIFPGAPPPPPRITPLPTKGMIAPSPALPAPAQLAGSPVAQSKSMQKVGVEPVQSKEISVRGMHSYSRTRTGPRGSLRNQTHQLYGASDSYLVARAKLSQALLTQVLTEPAAKNVLTIEVTLNRDVDDVLESIKRLGNIEVINVNGQKITLKLPLNLVLTVAKFPFVDHATEK